ncbi:hypothetical protein K440DRAFT_309485 [Wilcoxina mikolae CBS 423.85]|nr:hypothetical protein K440DRAFT_309485 [Wilcoxina mikolae CBS 423.85]
MLASAGRRYGARITIKHTTTGVFLFVRSLFYYLHIKPTYMPLFPCRHRLLRRILLQTRSPPVALYTSLSTRHYLHVAIHTSLFTRRYSHVDIHLLSSHCPLAIHSSLSIPPYLPLTITLGAQL